MTKQIELFLITLALSYTYAMTAIPEMPREPKPTTEHGCKCNSTCKASWHDLYKVKKILLFFSEIKRFKHSLKLQEDWCQTEADCGVTTKDRDGYWDRCSYEESEKFPWESLSWNDKQNGLWAAVQENDTYGPLEDHHVSLILIITTQ